MYQGDMKTLINRRGEGQFFINLCLNVIMIINNCPRGILSIAVMKLKFVSIG